MDKKECALYVSSFSENGKELLEQHLKDYNGDVLLHVFVPDLIYFPLLECIKLSDEDNIRKYCISIEEMWKRGDDEVLNVVEVSILECLTDDDNVWQIFGKHISNDFRDFINTDYIPRNSDWFNINLLK